MSLWRFLVASFAILIVSSCGFAGAKYRITSTDGKKRVIYDVLFGGSKVIERFTAFDPKSKKFVYLTWEVDKEAPKPVGRIWDHRTGETIKLYKFPGAEQPLPVIPHIKEMKVCPLTGDKKFKAEAVEFYD